MPRLLRERIGEDSILKLRSAALIRREDAVHLHAAGRWTAAAYLYGYSCEAFIKASYFRAVGIPATTPIQPSDRQNAVNEYAALGLFAKPKPHDILGWAQLLVAKRVALGQAYVPGFDVELLGQAQQIHFRWSEILRYRVNQPYAHEMRKISEASLWFAHNCDQM